MRIEGTIVSITNDDLNYTNQRVATGHSGGPLLNPKGQVIGVVLHVHSNIAVHRSGFASWKVTAETIRRAAAKRTPAGKTKTRPQVIVFSAPGCGPCLQLEQDVRAGHFGDYEFQFVNS